MKKKKHLVVATLLLIIAVVLIVGLFLRMPRTYETEAYSLSYPPSISVKETGEQEIEFYTQEQVGGVDYYPLSSWDAFYTLGSSSDVDGDMDSFLKEQGILQEDETLDAHMLDIGIRARNATLWERRAGIEREHFFVFTNAGHCYDLWFYGNALSDDEKTMMIDSFKVEGYI